jgi:hypothetical protein
MLSSTTPAGGGPCELFYTLAGDISGCNPSSTGMLIPEQCMALCPPTNMYPGPVAFCSVAGGNGSPPTLTCVYSGCVTGRRPEGLAPLAPDARGAATTDAVARCLAEMAWLEAASVPAFERLSRELEAHGAPRRLQTAARRAAGDEVRHARAMGALAARAGALVGEPRVEEREVRSLEDIAIENAIEGCVRETFGAAVAAVQAKRAGDGRFRHAMKTIAREEASHAQLSWAVAAWIDGQLDDGARARVKAARDRAADGLLRETAVEPETAIAQRLGVPTAVEARAMLQSLRASLWS